MPTQTELPTQGLLFSEPFFSETGIWCELKEGINPQDWAYLCRYLGNMGPEEFSKARKRVFGNPDSVFRRLKRLFRFRQDEVEGVPVVWLGHDNI